MQPQGGLTGQGQGQDFWPSPFQSLPCTPLCFPEMPGAGSEPAGVGGTSPQSSCLSAHPARGALEGRWQAEPS